MHLRSFFRRGLLPLAVALLPALCAAEEYAPLTYLAPGVDVNIIMNSTRFYDVGKGACFWVQNLDMLKELHARTGSFSFMGTLKGYVQQEYVSADAFKDLVNDSNTCWFNAGSNAIQYWQDSYAPFYKSAAQGGRTLPQGLTYNKDNLEILGGTQSLKVNMAFYDKWQDVGGVATDAFDWYLSGKSEIFDGGFFKEYYNGINAGKECGIYSSQGVVDMEKVTAGIFESFGLKRQDDGTLQLVEQGLIPTLSVGNNAAAHALTCYGFTLGTDGMVNSIYIADSDDARYRLEHIYLKVETDSQNNQRLLMFEDEACTKGWHIDGEAKWGLTGIYHINTPEQLKTLYTQYHDPDTPMVWSGNGSSSCWSTETTSGWNVTIDGETYNGGYENGRIARFTDAASQFTILVEGAIVAERMEVTNVEHDYRFQLDQITASLKIGTLVKTGTGGLRFDGAPLTVDTLELGKESSIVVGAKTTIKTREGADGALLEKVSVSRGLIAGTDRQASLADGLYIESEADLMIQSMTITANNEIHVGNNTITLNDVTIKISDDVCSLANGIFTIDLKNLINCDLEMENVLLDASELTLPQGFDPATTTVAFDFGDDVSIKQATGLDMRVGNYWSPSVSTDDQGRVVFKNLVETPEPTTGTLGLLALAALAARRRKR